MARRSPTRLELTLLLAVAPLFAGCDGPEERRCVDANGVYLDERRCDPRDPAYAPGSHAVYVPHRHYTGVGTRAGSFSSATSPGSGHAAVTRGGFGGTGAAHGHGGG